MATIKEMRSYLNKPIEDYGAYTSPEYESFQRKYKNCIKGIASEIGGELVRFSPNHYEFSCFVKRNDKFVYISISDVRYWRNGWYNNILIRTAQHDRDFTGGRNEYTNLDGLRDKIIELTK